MSSRLSFDPIAVLVALARTSVDFVLVGGVAGGAHGSAYPTYDVDIAVEGSPGNLRRLEEALDGLGATSQLLNAGGLVQTRSGTVDVTVYASGSSDYRRLRRGAPVATIQGQQIRIASIDDLIRMREARQGPYDALLSLELRAIADEQRRQS